jgi:hypothetical protein
MKIAFPLLAAAIAGFAAPALAEEATTKPAQDETSKEAKKDQKICRLVALQAGSRRKERVCLTPAEWRENNNPR